MKANEKSPQPSNLEKATFAGGCFWCMVKPFHKYEGVYSVVSGYTGGDLKSPDYEQVKTGTTGHQEAVEIEFDPSKISYRDLLEVFWRAIDPTDQGGQFGDRGTQYKPVIFYHSDRQRELAEESRKNLNESGRFQSAVKVPILAAKEFYPAEEYHQDYYKKNPERYEAYRVGSGRAGFIDKSWGKESDYKIKKEATPSTQELKSKLSPLEYHVTQEGGTERAFDNKYWDNKREGIYVDVVSGEALFSSKDKYDSGSGWPSFTQPINSDKLYEKLDKSHGMNRREIRSSSADSHLGHVFDDGPGPDGHRFCVNSASLRFIPREEMEAQGYGEYLKIFEEK